MNKLLSVSALALIISFSSGANAAFQGPTPEASTIAEALQMKDDAPVVINGQIEKSLGGEKYLLKDATGSITIEIDDDDWRGLDVTPQDVVTVKGEVDKDMFNTEIDVDSIGLKK